MNKQLWMDAAKKAGLEQFEIYEQRHTSTSINVYEQKVDSFSISDCDGIAMRGIYQEKMGNCFLEEVDDAQIDDVLDQIKQNASIITAEDKVMILAPAESYPTIQKHKNALLETENSLKIQKLKELEETVKQMDSRIAQVMTTTYEESVAVRSIVNTKGMDLCDSDSCSIVYVEVLAKDGEDTKSAFDWLYIKDLEALDIPAFAHKLCDKVINKLHADTIESGNYPLLMEKSAMTSLFSALAGLFDGENAFKGISILKDKLDEAIFDAKISVIDDPLMEDGINSASFDDEGTACYTKTVVDKGILKTYLHNSKSAELMQTTSTGNGFKGGYGGPVGISPTNFYIKNGTASYEEMIKTMKKGVIVTNLNGLHAGLNPVSTEFSLQSEGFYVEDGVIVKPINLFTISGNFLDMMKHIKMVGNDCKMGMSGVGTPSILFETIAVSGK